MWLHSCYTYSYTFHSTFSSYKNFPFSNSFRSKHVVSCRNDVDVVAKGWFLSLSIWCRKREILRKYLLCKFYGVFMVKISENYESLCYLDTQNV